MENKNIVVSVYCMAYNHEPYIRDALEGFVNQKTDFEYEVIVHDDASTDRTPEIVREYAEKYPNIIKPILQEENQYSKRVNILKNYIIPNVHGRYIAICEGDDYWCDTTKLQKQVEFMEKNQEYSACVHNTLLFDMETNEQQVMYGEETKTLSLEDVILYGGQAYHTSSVFYRVQYIYDRPDYLDAIREIGDYPLSVYLATQGKVQYFGEVMSFYRYNVQGSWTARQKKSRNNYIDTYKNIVNMLRMAKEENAPYYSELFEEAINRNEYKYKLWSRDYSAIKEGRFRKYYLQEPFSEKVKITLKRKLYALYGLYNQIRKEK